MPPPGRAGLRRPDAGLTAPIVARSPRQLMHFFDGVELLEPGVVSCSLWQPDHSEIGIPVVVFHFSGVGRK